MAGIDALIFRQLFEKESSTYTYLLADADTKEVLCGDSSPIWEMDMRMRTIAH